MKVATLKQMSTWEVGQQSKGMKVLQSSETLMLRQFFDRFIRCKWFDIAIKNISRLKGQIYSKNIPLLLIGQQFVSSFFYKCCSGWCQKKETLLLHFGATLKEGENTLVDMSYSFRKNQAVDAEEDSLGSLYHWKIQCKEWYNLNSIPVCLLECISSVNELLFWSKDEVHILNLSILYQAGIYL